eukprot:GHVU01043702.1.p1 GENE.GHVU01043702.1~~GHVU01043702.1.p1  ORF type:complete len:306 (+),score=12.60 GHVU01043702.1:154-1071(+)
MTFPGVSGGWQACVPERPFTRYIPAPVLCYDVRGFVGSYRDTAYSQLFDPHPSGLSVLQQIHAADGSGFAAVAKAFKAFPQGGAKILVSGPLSPLTTEISINQALLDAVEAAHEHSSDAKAKGTTGRASLKETWSSSHAFNVGGRMFHLRVHKKSKLRVVISEGAADPHPNAGPFLIASIRTPPQDHAGRMRKDNDDCDASMCMDAPVLHLRGPWLDFTGTTNVTARIVEKTLRSFGAARIRLNEVDEPLTVYEALPQDQVNPGVGQRSATRGGESGFLGRMRVIVHRNREHLSRRAPVSNTAVA